MSDTGMGGFAAAEAQMETGMPPSSLKEKYNEMTKPAKMALPIQVNHPGGHVERYTSLEARKEHDKQMDDLEIYSLQASHTRHKRMVALLECELALRGYPVNKEDKNELARTV